MATENDAFLSDTASYFCIYVKFQGCRYLRSRPKNVGNEENEGEKAGKPAFQMKWPKIEILTHHSLNSKVICYQAAHFEEEPKLEKGVKSPANN